MTTMDTLLSQQVLAALIAAPAHIAQQHAQRLEPSDFPDWRHRKVFEAFTHCEIADHSEPGSTIIQINAWLLEAGHYRDRDDGLRQEVADLAGIIGHPEQLAVFVTELVERRFRSAMSEHAAALAEHAESAPLEEITDQINEAITELRRLWTRVPAPKTLRTVKEAAA